MPSVYTFFDSSSAGSSPATTPINVSPCERSRWSDSTLATLKPTLSTRRSLPELRISVISTTTLDTLDSADSDETPPTVPPKSPSLAYYREPRSTYLGEATMASQYYSPSVRDGRATTTSAGQSPAFQPGSQPLSSHSPDPSSHFVASRQSEVPPWMADHDATSISSSHLSPGLTEDSPSLASTHSPRTPSPTLLHSHSNKRAGVVLPSPLWNQAAAQHQKTSEHLHPQMDRKHRAISAPSPMDNAMSPGRYFSFYQEQAQARAQNSRQHIQSLPQQCPKPSNGGKKLWDGLKGLFRKGSDEKLNSPEEIQIRHWTDA